MNKLIQFILALALAGAAAHSGAAPRAAEDPTAVVISTTASAPKVKREAGAEKRQVQQTKKSKAKATKASGKKKVGKQVSAKSRQSKTKSGKKAR